MTGFGASEAVSNNYRLKVEIKTLNSKFFDPLVKLPRDLSEFEASIKALLMTHLKRGKINVLMDLVPVGKVRPSISCNEVLFKAYYHQYEQLASQVGADQAELFKLALNSPDVLVAEEEKEELPWEWVKDTLMVAIEKCMHFRQAEGHKLQEELANYINSIRAGLDEVTKRDPERIASIRERVGNGLEEIRDKTSVDQNRFEQELIYYIEKLDITEEKVRLRGHLDYFEEVMEHPESQGKKLGFISQEIGREINTIGSKANDATIQHAVVRMKDELEKIKEQTLNII